MKKNRLSMIEHVREMMNAIDDVLPQRATSSSVVMPTQELINCAVEITRIVCEAEAKINWQKTKQRLIDELHWTPEEEVREGIAVLVAYFSKNQYPVKEAPIIKEKAQLAIDLVLAKHDGEIH